MSNSSLARRAPKAMACAIFLLASPAIHAEGGTYNPAARLQAQYRMRLPGGQSCRDLDQKLMLHSGFSIAAADGDLVIQGGRLQHWTIQPSFGICERVWIRDLDRNGQPDLILAGPTMGNGMAPTTRIFVVMVDSAGQPIPWETYDYAGWDNDGPLALVDFNRDGRAEIYRATYGNSDHDQFSYWIWSLFEARAGLWHAITGSHGAIRVPLFSKFTFANHDLPSWFAPGQEPAVELESNAGYGEPAVKIVRQVPRVQRNELPPRRSGEGLSTYYTRSSFHTSSQLVLSDGRTCAINGYVDLLVNRKNGRTWIPGDAKDFQPRLTKAIRESWPVRVASSATKGYCFVKSLWLDEP